VDGWGMGGIGEGMAGLRGKKDTLLRNAAGGVWGFHLPRGAGWGRYYHNPLYSQIPDIFFDFKILICLFVNKLIKPKSTMIKIKKPENSRKVKCVYRIDIGKKYFIWKALSFTQSIKQLEEDLAWKIKSLKLKETDLFYKMVSYMKKYRVYNLEATILFETDDPKELINFEAEQLAAAKLDDDSLNSSFDPLIPKWLHEELNKSSVRRNNNQTVHSFKKNEKVSEIEEKSHTEGKDTIVSTTETKNQTLIDKIDVKSILRRFKDAKA
jgi:hypothetical protein